MAENTYRHELKYLVGPMEYTVLRSRLASVLKHDEHVSADGCYLVRSIYFDNTDDKVLREKINGVQKREKWRIRYYNDDFSFITLEKKCKINNLCMKFDAKITEKECQAILNGTIDWMIFHPSELVKELYFKIKSQQLIPKVLVSYVREPYIYPAGNVRITFDSQIRTSLYHQVFLEQSIQDISALDTPQDRILEIKYDAFLPEIISHLIQTNQLRQSAFSKYGVCRRFG